MTLLTLEQNIVQLVKLDLYTHLSIFTLFLNDLQSFRQGLDWNVVSALFKKLYINISCNIYHDV